MENKEVENYLQEAIGNIRDDRAITSKLLVEIMSYISQSEERHQEVGSVAAKYVETLQRSNEQLVKVAALLQKKSESQAGLSEDDKKELFDLIKEA